jgi:sulfur carrier protein ThiS
MKVTLKLFATLTDYLPAQARSANQVEVDIEPHTTITELVARYQVPPKQVHLVLVNGHYIAPELRASRTLAQGDALAIWPPIAGG